jgi:hypothetical protein
MGSFRKTPQQRCASGKRDRAAELKSECAQHMVQEIGRRLASAANAGRTSSYELDAEVAVRRNAQCNAAAQGRLGIFVSVKPHRELDAGTDLIHPEYGLLWKFGDVNRSLGARQTWRCRLSTT